MYKYVSLAATAAVATMVSFGATGVTPAQAATITVTDTAITVDCPDGVCKGFTGGADWIDVNADPRIREFPSSQGVLSITIADLYDVQPSNETREAQALDILIDGLDNDDFVAADGTKTDMGGADNATFSSKAAYIAFKIGLGHFFLALQTPTEVELIFAKNGESGGGFSHRTEFGTSVIPLPAGLVLFLSGLAGIGFLGRYKAKRREPAII